MSLIPWLILLSTLSRLGPPLIARFSPRVAPFCPCDSIEVGRSNLRSLVGDVGETMEATLMLLAEGETSAWGTKLVATGEGVLSASDDWYPEPAGLRPFTLKEAADVSGKSKGVSLPREEGDW